MSTEKSKATTPAEMELVLGAGGVKGYAHIGVLKAIEKHKIKIGMVTGVSIGALIAAFYSNGFCASEIENILASEGFMKEGGRTMQRWRTALTALALHREGLANLAPILEKVVRKYKLLPNKNLRIIAFNVRTMAPVVFTGVDYNLATAMAASCSVPFVMEPVLNKMKSSSQRMAAKSEILVDGFLHHTHPSSFCKGPAIISKLGFASSLPSELLPATEMLLHFAEQLNSPWLNWFYDDPPGREHILVESGMSDVAALSFSTSPRKCKRMVEHAEQVADRQLRLARIAGRLASKKS